MRYIIDHVTLLKIPGGLYTAITRRYYKSQVVLVDCLDKELEWASCRIVKPDALMKKSVEKVVTTPVVYHHPVLALRFPYLKLREDRLSVFEYLQQDEDWKTSEDNSTLVVRRDGDYYLFQDYAEFLRVLPPYHQKPPT